MLALIGVDFDPYLSMTGSFATILRLLALRKEQLTVPLLNFLNVGILAMPATLLTTHR